MAERVVTTDVLVYNYDPPPDPQAKMVLLTSGKMAIIGRWAEVIDAIGWAPLPKRDKQEEDKRGLI